MNLFRRAGSEENGGATVEFVIVFPLLIAIVLSMFESGWLMTKYMMLDRGVDKAMREVKLGMITGGTQAEIQTNILNRICDYSEILQDCETELRIEMGVINSDGSTTVDANFPRNQADCHSRDPGVVIDPVMTANQNHLGRSEVVVVRACMLVDPIMPGIGLGAWLPKAEGGGHQMVSYGVFRNEPS